MNLNFVFSVQNISNHLQIAWTLVSVHNFQFAIEWGAFYGLIMNFFVMNFFDLAVCQQFEYLNNFQIFKFLNFMKRLNILNKNSNCIRIHWKWLRLKNWLKNFQERVTCTSTFSFRVSLTSFLGIIPSFF